MMGSTKLLSVLVVISLAVGCKDTDRPGPALETKPRPCEPQPCVEPKLDPSGGTKPAPVPPVEKALLAINVSPDRYDFFKVDVPEAFQCQKGQPCPTTFVPCWCPLTCRLCRPLELFITQQKVATDFDDLKKKFGVQHILVPSHPEDKPVPPRPITPGSGSAVK
jgi:hypothetical protein